MRTIARRSGARSESAVGGELALAMLAFGALALMRVQYSPRPVVVPSVVPPTGPASTPEREQWDKERVHLEGLLQSRINFYLLFSTLLLGLAVQIGDGRLKWATLFVGSVVSTLMSVTVLRTTILVRRVLDELCRLAPTHPYSMIRKPQFLNANYWLVGIVFVITISLWALLFWFCGEPWRFSPSPLRMEL